MQRKAVWFTTDSSNQLERLDVVDYIERRFRLHPKGFGSGTYNRCQIDYYCFSKAKVRKIRKLLRKEFPKTKVL